MLQVSCLFVIFSKQLFFSQGLDEVTFLKESLIENVSVKELNHPRCIIFNHMYVSEVSQSLAAVASGFCCLCYQLLHGHPHGQRREEGGGEEEWGEQQGTCWGLLSPPWAGSETWEDGLEYLQFLCLKSLRMIYFPHFNSSLCSDKRCFSGRARQGRLWAVTVAPRVPQQSLDNGFRTVRGCSVRIF